ncbi:MAG: hypothetical protein GY803_28515, partial [Chloroflexi bacterium]|nr:hypothetical protein [Chloroflexota bacterium]
VLLMGVAPLTMWYRSSVQRLGIALQWPAAAATVIVVILFALNVRGWFPLLGLWVTVLAMVLTALEFWKGTRARMKRGEPVWTAFSRLMARNQRRYGGYWIHIGVLMMAFGIIGIEVYQQETQQRLENGERLTMGRYEVELLGMERYPGPDDLLITEATMNVYENGALVSTINPRTELYTRTGQPMTIPDLRSTIADDLYVLLVNWEPTSATGATFRVYLNPLVNWVWAGGFVFVLGTLIAAWPDAKKETAPVRSRRVAVGAAD